MSQSLFSPREIFKALSGAVTHIDASQKWWFQFVQLEHPSLGLENDNNWKHVLRKDFNLSILSSAKQSRYMEKFVRKEAGFVGTLKDLFMDVD